MSSAVGAALKKLAVYIFTDKKALKTVLEIVLGIIIIIIMPIVAVVSIFNGNIAIDTDRLQTMVVQNLSAEEKSKLQFVEDTMNSIDEKMKAAGFDGRVKEAQVLYVLTLSDSSHDPDFADKLVSCFQEIQTDEQLITAVNSVFGKQLTSDDFEKVMGNIRSLYIDISDYTDPKTKNNLDLVKWAKHAQENGWGYVWGSHGNLLNKTELERLESVFSSHVTDYDDFIRHNWIGKRTADCVGLIKGYGWYDTESGKITVGSNGMQDVTADGMFSAATEKGTIDTIPEIRGIAVWHEGHIGIYIGNGEVIHAANTKAGVICTPIGQSGWTHWLKVPYIKYIEESEKSTS